MENKKTLNKTKMVGYIKRVISYIGAIALGMMIVAMIEYGVCLDTVVGIVLATIVMITPIIDKEQEDIEEEI